MINQVGFKNFRRFEEFPLMDLGKINIFVGRNNAGKSTVLKALQLMKGNLNTLTNLPFRGGVRFVFDVNEMAELHIDSFERALYNKAERKEITLTSTIDNCYFSVVLDGENINQNDTVVSVPYSHIELKDDELHLTYDFHTLELFLEVGNVRNSANEELLNELSKEKSFILRDLDELSNTYKYLSSLVHNSSKTPEEGKSPEKGIISAISERQELETLIKKYRKQLISIENKINGIENNRIGDISIKIDDFVLIHEYSRENVFRQIFHSLYRIYRNETIDKRTTTFKNLVRIWESNFLPSKELQFQRALESFKIEYLNAHAASQKTIYLKDDRNDSLARALTDYCKGFGGGKALDFIKKWMDKDHFDIGEDFIIGNIEGAGYTLQIIEDGEIVNLADKGTGSIQLMTMLLNLAVIMNKTNGLSRTKSLILIEEPEQNIHPMLQSMLADMFLDFQKKTNCQLIIETHSEYLIRRTQVLVAEQKYADEEVLNENNPFKVYYFPTEKDQHPYNMIYRLDGKFENEFGSGFYDEANKLIFNIL